VTTTGADPSNVEPRVEALLDAVLTVASGLELETVLSRVVHAACDLVGARYGALGVLDEDGERLAAFLHEGMDAAQVAAVGELPSGEGVLGLLISDPEPIRLEDIKDHPRSAGFPAHHPPMHGFLGVPIRISGEVYGNLYLTEKADGSTFTAEDEELMVGLAAVAGSAIANARLYEESRRRERWRRATAEVASAVLDGEPAQLVRHRVVSGAQELLHGEAACLVEAHEDGLWVLACAGAGPGEGFLDAPGAPVERTLTEAAPLRTPVGPVFGHPAAWAPVQVGGEVVAALGVGREQPFTERELEELVSFASQVNVAWSFERAQAEVQQLSVVADRERIGRDLHDTVIQRLFATGLSLQAAQRKLDDPDAVHERLERAVDDIDGIVREIRATIFALQSSGDTERGVRARVLEVVEELSKVLPRAPRVRFDGPIDTVVGPQVGDHLVPVVREALTNVAKHAAADDVELELAADHAGVRLRIADDGSGIRQGAPAGFGLRNLRQRADALGGSMRIGSAGPDGGTELIWTVPGP